MVRKEQRELILPIGIDGTKNWVLASDERMKQLMLSTIEESTSSGISGSNQNIPPAMLSTKISEIDLAKSPVSDQATDSQQKIELMKAPVSHENVEFSTIEQNLIDSNGNNEPAFPIIIGSANSYSANGSAIHKAGLAKDLVDTSKSVLIGETTHGSMVQIPAVTFDTSSPNLNSSFRNGTEQKLEHDITNGKEMQVSSNMEDKVAISNGYTDGSIQNVPPITFDTWDISHESENKFERNEHCIEIPEILSHLNSTTAFNSSSLKEYFEWKIFTLSTYNSFQKSEVNNVFRADKAEPFDVNTQRQYHCEIFKKSFQNLTSEERKTFLEDNVQEFREMIGYNEWNCTPFPFPMRKMPNSWLKDSQDNLPLVQKAFYRLLNFDEMMQSFCYMQAFHVLREYDRNSLLYWDLLKISKISLQNLEELEKIFTKPFLFSSTFREGSKDEWFHNSYLILSGETNWFKKDFSVWISERQEFLVDVACQVNVQIGIQSLWRALDKRKRTLETYISSKNRSPERGLLHLLEVTRRNREQIYKEWFKQKIVLDGCSGYLFVGGMWTGFREHRLPDNEAIGGFPRDFDKTLQIPYSATHNEEQIESVSFHIHYLRAFHLLNACHTLQDPGFELLWLVDEFLETTKDLNQGYEFICLHVTTREHTGIYLAPCGHWIMLFSKDFMIKTIKINFDEMDNIITFDGFLSVRFGELREMLEEMRPTLREFHQAFQRNDLYMKNLLLRHKEKVATLSENFWNDHQVVSYDAEKHFSAGFESKLGRW